MGQLLKIVTSSAWLLLCVVMAVQPADAQKRYPSIDDAWDATDYRAVVQRVAKDGLELPTLADPATKPVFDRMVNTDNIPLRMGVNPELAATLRFQKLDGVLQPIHKLVALYATETQKGKPYATELARLMVYECKISGALLEVSEPFLATLTKDARYDARVADLNQIKTGARQIYSGIVQGVTDERLYSKPEILKMISGALADLPSYQLIFTDKDRLELTQKLAQRISTATDQELKDAMTQLRDAIEHRRMRT
jgi:hypothetical protein